MWQNIFKICFLLIATTVAFCYASPRMTSLTLTLLPNEDREHPFKKVGGKYYHFARDEEVSWFKALLTCATMGANLASFHTLDEWQALSDHLIKYYPRKKNWWISASDLESEDDFSWYRTGERVAYTVWSVDQPDNNDGIENCVILWKRNNQFEMNDYDCDKIAHYICEASKPITLVIHAT
ncbi:C-type lectin 37Db-like [Calliphora vicina]|uniref:C-type lectin 37Db-like n=1 Tax=Calliphora vicina TaxID=7373 RepID=UPI00325B18B0